MDLHEIKALMDMMVDAGVNELSIKEKGFEIELKRGVPVAAASAAAPVAALHTEPQPQHEIPKPVEKEGVYITSPMVGTYYSSPSPDDPPFVKVGDMVTPDTVICIIEAMKVMNEVKAGESGKVIEILVDSGEAVEFGTKLVRIE